MKFSVCIPMYNEIKNAARTAQVLCAAAEEMCESARNSFTEYEIIFYDDGSGDGTFESVPTELDACRHGKVLKFRAEQNRGKGAALRGAVAHSTGDVVLYTDCDLAYGTEVIARALEEYERTSPDMLVGSRAIHPDGYAGYTFTRRTASKAYMKVLTVYAGFRMTDSQCGFKLFRGEAGRRLFSLAETDGWAFDLELFLLAKKLSYKVRELPVKIITHKESRIHVVRDSIRMLYELHRIKKRVSSLKV